MKVPEAPAALLVPVVPRVQAHPVLQVLPEVPEDLRARLVLGVPADLPHSN